MEISELIEKVDIVEFLSQYTELEQRGGEFWGLSPLREEKTPSFSVRPETGKFFDFSSGIGGSVITFIKHYYHCNGYEAVNMLKDYIGVSEDEPVGAPTHLPATSVCKQYHIQKKAEKSTGSKPKNLTDYTLRFLNDTEKREAWRKDGITDEAMDFFQVRYDDFSNRLVYPIYDENGLLANIGGRTLDPDFKEKGLRKYTYFSSWNGSMDLIYGLWENRDAIAAKREVILFEGMKSVMLARGFGFLNCGAVLTSHLSAGQMKLLIKLGCSVVFAFDKDVDARKDHNIQKLKQYVSVFALWDKDGLLEEKDAPVDKGEEVFRKLYDGRRRL